MKLQRFCKESEMLAPPAEVFAWHEQPGAVERLTPLWERVEMVQRACNSGVNVIAGLVAYTFREKKLSLHLRDHPLLPAVL
jgi:ligand-binding SRPBCC domain-containing protein